MQKYINLLIIILLIVGCDSAPTKPREYVEYKRKADPMRLPLTNDQPSLLNDMRNSNIDVSDSVLDLPIQWRTPTKWNEKISGNNIRLATFTNEDETLDVSIVILAGTAGGMNANVMRWGQQIGINLNDGSLSELLQQSGTVEIGIGTAQLVNFSLLMSEIELSRTSILAAIIESPEGSIFVKANGSQVTLNSEKDNFIELIKSIQFNEK